MSQAGPTATPTPDADLVVRPRLLERLDAVRRGQVAVISAPPGYGKNELVDTWFAASPDLVRVPVPAPMTRAEVRDALDKALTDSPAGSTAVLFVNDAHLATDAEAMTPLVDAATASDVRLVIASRVRPDIPLGALAARSRLVDIDGPELASTADEVRELLAAHGRSSDEATVARMMEVSGGWPVVIRMIVGMRLSLDQPERLQRLMDSYIEDRVASFLSAQDAEMLMTLSLVRVLNPQTANMLTRRGDTAAQLSRLQSIGVPISWSTRNTITVNPALASYFRRQLLLREPERASELLQRAALWLRDHDRVDEAVQLAQDSHTFGLGWMIIGDFVVRHLYEPEELAKAPALLDMLPTGWERELLLAVSGGRSNPEAMLSHLHSITSGNMIDTTVVGRSSIALFFLGMLRRAGYPPYSGTNDVVAMAASISEDEVTDMQRAQFAALQLEYGLWLLHMDRLEEAKARLVQGLGLGRLTRTPWIGVMGTGALGLIHAAQGNRETALGLLQESQMAWRQNRFDASIIEYAVIGEALLDLDLTTPSEHLAALEHTLSDDHRLRELDGMGAAVQALHRVSGGDPQGALRILDAFRDQPHVTSVTTPRILVAAAAAVANIRLNRCEAARAELDTVAAVSLPSSGPWRDVLAAQVELTSGNADAAMEILRPWLDDSHGTDARVTLAMLSTFATAAAHVGDFELSSSASDRARGLARRMGVANLEARYVTLRRSGGHEVDLTEAERKVLTHLDSSQTLGQTAEALFISTNTLKTHLRRIYRKLEVGGREEAIQRARALGIIGPGN